MILLGFHTMWYGAYNGFYRRRIPDRLRFDLAEATGGKAVCLGIVTIIVGLMISMSATYIAFIRV